MTNLLRETLEAIEASGHSVGDVVFIGSANREYACTWDEFKKLADTEYDAGYGAAEVAGDLEIHFSDGRHMWRHEYDGSERWDWDVPPSGLWTGEPKPINRLIGGMWPSVAGLQGDDA